MIAFDSKRLPDSIVQLKERNSYELLPHLTRSLVSLRVCVVGVCVLCTNAS